MKYKAYVEGIEYQSITEACKAYHIESHIEAIRKRILAGWSIEKAILTPIQPHRHPVDFNGSEYNSINKACKNEGKNRSTVEKLIKKKGLTPEEALKSARTNKTQKGIRTIVENTTYNSFASACRQYKKEPSTVRKRKSKTLNNDEPFIVPVGQWNTQNKQTKSSNTKEITIEINGKQVTYPSLSKFCKENNIKRQTFQNLLKKNNNNIQDALIILKGKEKSKSSHIEKLENLLKQGHDEQKCIVKIYDRNTQNITEKTYSNFNINILNTSEFEVEISIKNKIIIKNYDIYKCVNNKNKLAIYAKINTINIYIIINK